MPVLRKASSRWQQATNPHYMDNFEKLFQEKRKNTGGTKAMGPNLDKEILQMQSSEWFKLLNLGVKSYQQKDYQTAIKHLNQAIKLKPDHAHLFEVRAKFKEDAGDAEGAIQDYKNSLHYRNDAYNIYNQIANNYFRLKQFQKALLAFNIAIELKDNLKKQGMSEDLLPQFANGAVQKVPKEVILTNRANAKLNLKDFQGCLDDCELASEINPNYSNTYFIAGMMFLQVNQPNEALGALKQAEKLGNAQASMIIRQFFK